jgi:hypothetical protein
MSATMLPPIASVQEERYPLQNPSAGIPVVFRPGKRAVPRIVIRNPLVLDSHYVSRPNQKCSDSHATRTTQHPNVRKSRADH